MELAEIIRSILREPEDMIGTETVQVHPEHSYVLDLETAKRERTAFARLVADIPNIEGGLSWQLLKPYCNGNGSLAMACIAIGKVLGLWGIYPDPETSRSLYMTRGVMLPTSGVVEAWPAWSEVGIDSEGHPIVEKTGADENPYVDADLEAYLKSFQ
jgi:hypothetical protein